MSRDSWQAVRAVFLAAIMIISVFAAGIAFSGSAAAAVTNVSDGESIQSAINGANPGDTIIVEAGTYDESVTVNVSDITVEGPNTGTSGDGTRSTEATIEHGVVIAANNVTFAGFEVNNDDVNGITVSGAPDDVTITNNLVTDVGGGTAGPKGVGNGINLQYTDSFEETSSGIEITDNQITNITTSDNASGDADAIGIQVLPRGNDVEDLLIQGNAINDIEPGDNAGGRAEARGISVDTQFQDTPVTLNGGGTRGDFGQATNLTIDDNKIRNLNSEFSRAIGLFEDKGGDTTTNDAIGPVNFSITNNTIEQITSTSDLPAESIFVGGYQDMGTAHEVRNNNFLAIVENFGDSSNTLNAEDNWWGSANGPTASANTYNNGSQGTPVIGNVDFTPWLDASTDSGGQSFAPVTNDSGGQFASIQATVDAASLGDTITVSSGTYQESVVIESGNVSLVGNDNPTIIGDGVGSEPQAAIHVDDSSGPVRNVTIRGLTVENPDGKFGIFAGTGSTNNDPDGIGGLVISNNAIQDVSTDSTGSALTGGPAGIGIRGDYGTDGNPGIEISDNEINNVENLEGGPEPVGITLKSFTGDAGFGVDSNGDSLTDPVSPPATDTDILNNEISNISSNGGFATKGISVSGEFEDVDIIGNQLETIESPGGDARAITLSENSLKPDEPESYEYDIDGDSNGERIGPQDFDIRSNTISDVNAADARSINFGGYEEFGDHSITQNTINDGAVTRFAGDQPGFQPGDGDALNFSDNTFTGQDTDVYFSDPGQSADLNIVFESNTFEKPVTIEDDAGNLNSSSIFGAIQPAVDEASPGDTVNVSSGTYNESVEISTPNVTVSGAGDPRSSVDTTIEGLVTVDAQKAELRTVIVAPPTFDSDSESQAVLVTASEATVDDVIVDIDVEVTEPDGFFEAQAIQVFASDSEPISDVVISDNIVIGDATQSNDALAGVTGISDQGNTTDTLIVNNDIDVTSEGYSFGVVTRASATDGLTGTPSSEVLFNDITATGGTLNGVGYGIEPVGTREDVTEVQVDAEEQLLKYNNFEDIDSIEHKAASGTLDLTVNTWEDPGEVQFLTDAFGNDIEDGGEIVFDPILTEEKSVNRFDELLTENDGEIVATTDDYGSYIEVERDGGPVFIGFPATSEKPISELLSEDTLSREDGEAVTLFIYDNEDENEKFQPVFDPANRTPEAGEVLIIATESGISEDIVVPINTTAPRTGPNPDTGTVELNEGWNLVATGAVDSPGALATSQVITDFQFRERAQPAQPGAPPAGFGAYEGTWLFVESDGEIFTGYAENQRPADYLDAVLTPESDDQNDDDT